jgi:N-acetylmuramoyl-L-alanine amidase-like
MRKLFTIFIFLLLYQPGLAAPVNSHAEIRSLLQQHVSTRPLLDRINTFSQYFQGRSYLHQPLGEGESGQFDQRPLFRTDGFDCLTFVETVLALAHGRTFAEFKGYLAHIRYYQGKVDFLHRNHFVSVDWNKHNEQLGFVRDMTYQFVGVQAQVAVATIDKPAWFAHRLRGTSSSLTPLLAFLKPELSAVVYLPFSALFDAKGVVNSAVLAQLPDVSIVEIVRPNWRLRDKIGTDLQISHLGFAIKTPAGYLFRHASSQAHKVVTEPLVAYLKRAARSPTIKGITVLSIPIRSRCEITA